MIDFRYHLVSLVAVFLALSVGIVLGAGPLKGTIDSGVSSTLTNEVAALRADKAALNEELASVRSSNDGGQALIAQLSPTAVHDVLAGRSVAIIVLPEADADMVSAVRTNITQAGATIASALTLDPSWLTSTEADRSSTFTELAAVLSVPGDGDKPADRDAAVLATLLTGSPGVAPTAQEGRRTALNRIAALGLLEIDGDNLALATDLVILGGPITAGDSQARLAAANGWVALAGHFTGTAAGHVLADAVQPRPAGQEDQDAAVYVSERVRADLAVAPRLSSVDDADTAMGALSVVFALVAGRSGSVGHYGLAAGATAPYAPLPGS